MNSLFLTMAQKAPFVLYLLTLANGSLYKKEQVNFKHGLYGIASNQQFSETKTNIECGSICQAWTNHELNVGNSVCRAFRISEDGQCRLFQVWSLEASLVSYGSTREMFIKQDENLGNLQNSPLVEYLALLVALGFF